MKIEVKSMDSLKIIPESSSDRAILQAFLDMSFDKSRVFEIQSDSWCENLKEIHVGYGFRQEVSDK